MDPDPQDDTASRFGDRPLAHRLVPIAHALLFAALAAPWSKGRPADPATPSPGPSEVDVVHGIELGFGPVVGLLAVVSLLGLVLSGSRELRAGALMATFVAAGAWVAAFHIWGPGLACFLCEEQEVLWGAHVAAAGALLGMVLTGLGIDWGKARRRLKAELGK